MVSVLPSYPVSAPVLPPPRAISAPSSERVAFQSLNVTPAGFTATDFELAKKADGSSLRLFDVLDQGRPVILFFYPSQGTPFCNKQIADIQGMFGHTNAVLVGVSGVAPVGAPPLDMKNAPMLLLTDSGRAIQDAYHVNRRASVSDRVTLVLDPRTRMAHPAYVSSGFLPASGDHIRRASAILQQINVQNSIQDAFRSP